jgi:thiamine biosynthesis lipoprotein ApbE
LGEAEIVLSGDEDLSEENGNRYHHLLTRRTGYLKSARECPVAHRVLS